MDITTSLRHRSGQNGTHTGLSMGRGVAVVRGPRGHDSPFILFALAEEAIKTSTQQVVGLESVLVRDRLLSDAGHGMDRSACLDNRTLSGTAARTVSYSAISSEYFQLGSHQSRRPVVLGHRHRPVHGFHHWSLGRREMGHQDLQITNLTGNESKPRDPGYDYAAISDHSYFPELIGTDGNHRHQRQLPRDSPECSGCRRRFWPSEYCQ